MKTQPPTFERVAVLGAGAVGSYLAAQLAPHVDTVMLTRAAHARAIASDGLTISGTIDRVVELRAVSRLDDLPDGSLVVIASKMSALGELAQLATDRAGRDSTILCLQNGLAPEHVVEDLCAARGRRDLVVRRAITSAACNLVEPGHVEYWGGGFTFDAASEHSRAIASMWERCGLPITLTEVWRKLAVNCIANPICAVLGVRNDAIITPQLASLRAAVLDEVAVLARAEGVDLGADLLEFVDTALSRSRNRNSMVQDLARGRLTEIDHLNGAVVAQCARRGLQAPANEVLTGLIHALENAGQS